MSTSPYLFADLSSDETKAILRARMVAALRADGQPVDSWAPSSVGGSENTRLDMVAGGLQQFMAQRYAAAVRGRLVFTATDDPTTGFFLSYLGRKNYQLPKQQSTFTVQNEAITGNANASAADYGDGDLWVRSPTTGNRYRLTLAPGVTVHVAPSTTVFAPFQAENPGATYADPEGTVNQMVTAKAGLSCNNVRSTDYIAPPPTGNSPGVITASYTDPRILGPQQAVPPLYSVLRARIDVSGNVGSGAFSWSVDGGLTWTSGGFIQAVFPVSAGGWLKFANNTLSGTSFLAGSIFSFIVADAILQRGRDVEPDPIYQEHLSSRWSALSLPPTRSLIALWSMIASAEVTKVACQADPNTAGGILVTISSQTGPATAAAQVAVQQFISDRLGFKGIPAPTSPAVAGSRSPEETVLVSSATRLPIVVAGTVYVPRAQIAAAQAGADEPWNEYVGGLPIGGQRGALVELLRMEDLLGDLGAQDVQGLTINGAAADLTIPVGNEAQPSGTLTTSLNWVPV